MSDDEYRASTCEDLINALPAAFGFVPRESVIGMNLCGPRSRLGFRVRHDLPEPADDAVLARLLADHLMRNEGDAMIVVALSGQAERARAAALALASALPTERVALVIWADDERVWSTAASHPADGEPYTLSSHHPAMARAVALGQVILPDRSALLGEVAGRTGPARRRAERATDRIFRRFVAAAAAATDAEDFAAEQRRRAAALITRGLASAALGDEELIELALLVSSVTVRDAAWLRVDRLNGLQMHALWAAVARIAADEFAPNALFLAGFAAWQAGDGARALVAAERAVELDPEHRVSRMLLGVLEAGLNPDVWSQRKLSA